jgi:hypothetical protein
VINGYEFKSGSRYFLPEIIAAILAANSQALHPPGGHTDEPSGCCSVQMAVEPLSKSSFKGDLAQEEAVRLHEHGHNLKQGLLEKSKLAQHAHEEGHRVGWGDDKIL